MCPIKAFLLSYIKNFSRRGTYFFRPRRGRRKFSVAPLYKTLECKGQFGKYESFKEFIRNNEKD